jgi:hypothetical protein
MTPLQISMMLHYYVAATDYRDGDFSAPAVRRALEDFKASDMLRYCTVPFRDAAYEVTDKGRAFVKALCSVPEPTIKYVVVFDQPQQEGE